MAYGVIHARWFKWSVMKLWPPCFLLNQIWEDKICIAGQMFHVFLIAVSTVSISHKPMLHPPLHTIKNTLSSLSEALHATFASLCPGLNSKPRQLQDPSCRKWNLASATWQAAYLWRRETGGGISKQVCTHADQTTSFWVCWPACRFPLATSHYLSSWSLISWAISILGTWPF